MQPHLTKICTSCKEEKSIAEFHIRRKEQRPYSSCKKCRNEQGRIWKATPKAISLRKERELKKFYNLTLDQYKEILAAQGNGCAICGRTKPSRANNYFSVDHDHSTGLFRGLLCDPCNQALGLFKDSIETLRRAATYLERHNDAKLAGLLAMAETAKPESIHE